MFFSSNLIMMTGLELTRMILNTIDRTMKASLILDSITKQSFRNQIFSVFTVMMVHQRKIRWIVAEFLKLSTKLTYYQR